jgi:predicted RNA binding protein YcfA (HicA-like mRNA interferase family)
MRLIGPHPRPFPDQRVAHLCHANGAKPLDLQANGMHSIYMDSRVVIRRLKQDGWILVRTEGSHHQFEHPEKPGLVTVPHPKRDLPAGTLKAIFKAAGWS